jgi:hypothetical protein
MADPPRRGYGASGGGPSEPLVLAHRIQEMINIANSGAKDKRSAAFTAHIQSAR